MKTKKGDRKERKLGRKNKVKEKGGTGPCAKLTIGRTLMHAHRWAVGFVSNSHTYVFVCIDVRINR